MVPKQLLSGFLRKGKREGEQSGPLDISLFFGPVLLRSRMGPVVSILLVATGRLAPWSSPRLRNIVNNFILFTSPRDSLSPSALVHFPFLHS